MLDGSAKNALSVFSRFYYSITNLRTKKLDKRIYETEVDVYGLDHPPISSKWCNFYTILFRLQPIIRNVEQ